MAIGRSTSVEIINPRSPSIEITDTYINNSNNHVLPWPFTVEILENPLLLERAISDLTEYRDIAIEHLKQLQQEEGTEEDPINVLIAVIKAL